MPNKTPILSKQHHQEILVDMLRSANLQPTGTCAEDLQLELKRQTMELHNDSNEQETLQWLEAIADTKNWT